MYGVSNGFHFGLEPANPLVANSDWLITRVGVAREQLSEL